MPPKSKQKPAEWWDVRFFHRHRDDDPAEACPGLEFLYAIDPPAAKRLRAFLQSVAMAPPPQWSGGGIWEAMHGEMAGYYEVRTRAGDWLYRLFCFLEKEIEGLPRPSVVVIAGLKKKNQRAFRLEDYAWVRELGEEYKRRLPRSVL